MEKEIIEPESLYKPLGIYSHAVKATGAQWLFLSGVTPRDQTGKVVGSGDIHYQTRQVFENMKTVLDSAGATFDNIVKATTYVTDASLYPEIQKIRAEYFKEKYPASTLIQVEQLSSKEIMIEVEVVAVL
jgi:reactive intermediate/imine deaminase